MSLKQTILKLRDRLIARQVANYPLPAFGGDETVRLRAVFSGRVQHVGFRQEAAEMARRLGLTGFCENLANGDVLAELQGPRARGDCLIGFMRSLVRIRVRRVTAYPLPLVPGETGFSVKK